MNIQACTDEASQVECLMVKKEQNLFSLIWMQGSGMVLGVATPPFQSWNVTVNATIGECGSGLKIAFDFQRETYISTVFNDTVSCCIIRTQ